MKTNKKLWYCLMTLFWAMLLTTTAKAQVRVGGETDPQPGAVLDLEMKQGGSITDYYIGGLHLPNIDITDLEKIPGSLGNGAKTSATPYTFLSGQADKDTDLALAGMIVYNTNAATGKGVYYWDGYIWKKLNGESSINIVNPAGKDPFDPTIPTNKDPNDIGSPVFPEAGDTKGPFTPHDEPECTTTTPGYKVEIISGNAYAHLDYTGLSSAQKNMGAFLLTFDPNSNVYVRYAVVRVTNNCTLEYKDFLFSQEAATIGVFPNPSEPNVKPEGEDRGPYTPDADLTKCTGNYNVTSNQDWCIVTFNPATGKFSLRYLPNPDLTQRVATITITKGTCTKSYPVTQDAGNIILSPDPTEDGIETQASGGETNPATPQGNPTCSGQTVNYSISLVSGFGYAHLVILNVQSGQFKVKFDPSTSIYPRYAVVRVKDNCTGMTRDFTLTQSGQQVGISPDPSQPPVPAPGEDRGPFTPETNPEKCPAPVYSVTTNQSWCKAVITNTATGTFKLLFEPNYLSSSRYVNVTISATNCGISSTYRIEQKGANVDIGIGNYPVEPVSSEGGDTKQGIPNSEVRCDQNPAYIPTLISGNLYATLVVENVALGIFHVNFSANPSTSSRTATVRVTNPCNGLYSDFVYTQLGSDCTTKAITTTGFLSQSVEQGTVITQVTFNSLSSITVTGSSPGISISGRGSNTVTITGMPTTPGDYSFVASTGNAGCVNESKTFLLTVTADACAVLPTAPSGAEATRCGAGEVSLSVTGAGPGENYRWYDASGNLITEGVSTHNPTISATTTFYVAKYNTLGCETATTDRLEITATVTTLPVVGTITKTSGNSLMKIGETMQLSITTTGGTWASSNTTVATVDNTGKVTAIAEGTTTITYTITGTGGCAETNAVATFGETIQVTKHCPVKISSTEYIIMRCYNLGADEKTDWKVLQKALNGNYYQWGRTAPVATTASPDGILAGWTDAPANDKYIATWTESQPDPCTSELGTNWRLPTESEWRNIMTNNKSIYIGSWLIESSWTSGVRLEPTPGCGCGVLLPAASGRGVIDGHLMGVEVAKNMHGFYWSSSGSNAKRPTGYATVAHFSYIEGNVDSSVKESQRGFGMSARCIYN